MFSQSACSCDLASRHHHSGLIRRWSITCWKRTKRITLGTCHIPCPGSPHFHPGFNRNRPSPAAFHPQGPHARHHVIEKSHIPKQCIISIFRIHLTLQRHPWRWLRTPVQLSQCQTILRQAIWPISCGRDVFVLAALDMCLDRKWSYTEILKPSSTCGLRSS